MTALPRPACSRSPLRRARSAMLSAAVACACGGIAGCASYTTPGGPADLTDFGVKPALTAARAEQTDATMQQKFDRRPLAKFPASIAVARVQAPGYRSRTAGGFAGPGSLYSVVTNRDVEKPKHLERLAKLEMVQGVGPINRMLLPT